MTAESPDAFAKARKLSSDTICTCSSVRSAIELGGEALDAILGEHGLQLVGGHRGLELHLGSDVRQVLSHLHKKPLPIR